MSNDSFNFELVNMFACLMDQKNQTIEVQVSQIDRTNSIPEDRIQELDATHYLYDTNNPEVDGTIEFADSEIQISNGDNADIESLLHQDKDVPKTFDILIESASHSDSDHHGIIQNCLVLDRDSRADKNQRKGPTYTFIGQEIK